MSYQACFEVTEFWDLSNRFFFPYTTKPQNFRLGQTESSCRRQAKCCKKKFRKSFVEMVENVVGKGENAGYNHFLLFQQFFQWSFFLRYLKAGIVC